MHIKQITISNFRSFRQQPEIHPFSPMNNVLVGRNGSGKSNLFDAVSFVLLCPKFANLRSEERQALLHEGSGAAAINAFVEIVFDNSDNRLAVESDEVVIRRTIGHKKDEFFLQRKRVTKNDIANLLEGAGFSPSNPYFIVQQGKVNSLCVMSDLDRLNLLKEVAGTTVYDEKKAESLQKMEENRVNIEKIVENLVHMENKLDELRGEKEELIQYQKLDRERKAVEYSLYDKELRRARETLDQIEQKRLKDLDSRSELYEKVRKVDDAIQNVETDLMSKSKSLKRNRNEISSLEETKTTTLTHRTKLELACEELKEWIRTGEENIMSNEKELEQIQKEILGAQTDLQDRVQPKFDELKQALARATHDKDDAVKRMQGLYAKQGRGKQFRSREARDSFLQTQIDELTSVLEDKEVLLKEKQQGVVNLRRSVTSGLKDMEKKITEISKKQSSISELNKDIDDAKRKRNEFADKRKEYWRALDELNEKIMGAREDVKIASSTIRKLIPRATAMGLDALSSIVADEGIVVGTQYFGLVLQNFELVDTKFQTAIEVAANNALFHVIVDTDTTAARLMKRLERDRLGRVTFLPLNQLYIDNLQYPDSSDVVPILQKCIRYDAKVHKAMQHVFGKKLLARNVEIAATWSAQSNMDTITLDGDLCSRKGALSGGFVDVMKSRLKANANLNASEEILNQLDKQQEELNKACELIDHQVTSLMTDIQKLEAKRANLEQLLIRTEEDNEVQKTRVEASKVHYDKLEKEVIPSIENEIKSLKSQITFLQEEMESEPSMTLSDEEKNLLHQLKVIQTELNADIEAQTQSLDEISIERQRLLSLLNDNLLKRKTELQNNSVPDRLRTKDSSIPTSLAAAQLQWKEKLDLNERNMYEASHSLEGIEIKLQQARLEDEKLRTELISSKAELEKLKTIDAEYKKDLEMAQEDEEKLMTKRSLCVSKRELYMRKIQELGPLPPASELSKYAAMSIDTLIHELESVNKTLKMYSHVNKKAFDQFVSFSEQRDSLLLRKEELDHSAEKVKELVESLDRQKDEAINRTFRGVSSHFREVFKEIVPTGSGELIMKTKLDRQVIDDDSSDDDDSVSEDKSNVPSIDTYEGIGIRVSFSSVGENYIMSQLSGGQKALVALALMFAIQRCDPAPFYMFDELDQALDSTYRAAVAALIQRQASNEEYPTQFICSTFRPELVAVAARCYGISHQNKVSNIHLLSKKDALHFIASLMSEEEAVGEVTSLAVSQSLASRTLSRKRSIEAAAVEEENDEIHENASSSDGSDLVQRSRPRSLRGVGFGDGTEEHASIDEKDESFEEGSTAASVVSE